MIQSVPRINDLAVLALIKDLVQNEWERKIHEAWVNSPWLTRLLVDVLIICSIAPRLK